MMSDANFQHNIRKEQLIADEKKQQEEEHALRHQDDTAAQKAAFIQYVPPVSFSPCVMSVLIHCLPP